MFNFTKLIKTISALDVIETVLRANNGAVDSTIDQLLQISSENQNANSRPNNGPSKVSWIIIIQVTLNEQLITVSLLKPPSYSSSMQSNSPYNPSKNLNLNSTPKEKVQKSTLKQLDLLGNQAQQQLIDFDTIDAQACSTSFGRKATASRFNPPLVGSLPNDFLRITPNAEKISSQQSAVAANQNLIRQSSTSSGTDHQINHQLLRKKMEENERQRLTSNIDDKEIAQYLEDERIALMLQNQEFVEELRRNKEFMSALNYDAMSHNTRVKGFHSENHPGSHGASDSNAQNFSDADFKERIRKMSEMSRKKFAQLAGLFSKRKGSGLPSRDNLLLGDQYAQLENDYSDSEEYGQKKKPVNKQH